MNIIYDISSKVVGGKPWNFKLKISNFNKFKKATKIAYHVNKVLKWPSTNILSQAILAKQLTIKLYFHLARE